jgi:hypothetical protein
MDIYSNMPDSYDTWLRPSIMYLYYKLSENLVYIPNGGKNIQQKKKEFFQNIFFNYEKKQTKFFFYITDPNGTDNNKLDSGTDHNTLPYTSKWSSQQPSNNLFSSSHQNRYVE